MATLIEIGNYMRSANQGPLFNRFVGAVAKLAAQIVAEDAGTANHSNRLTWANEVFGGEAESKATELLQYGIASNATLQSVMEAATDNDIDYIVAQSVNVFSTGS